MTKGNGKTLSDDKTRDQIRGCIALNIYQSYETSMCIFLAQPGLICTGGKEKATFFFDVTFLCLFAMVYFSQ